MTTHEARHMTARPLPVGPALLLLGAALAAWAITVERMRGMDAGPGTDLGGLGWFLGIWVTMTVAMMLPSAMPTALLARSRSALPPLAFSAGYLAVWTAFGLAAHALFRVLNSMDLGWLEWDRGGPYVAGFAVVAAGIYELTPWKQRTLRGCRQGLDIAGPRAVREGVKNGLYCVGCCWGLMLVLFALGVMSLLWMALIAGVILAEKVLRSRVRLTRVAGIALVVLGIWVAASPSSVPGLTEPGHEPTMQMKMHNTAP
jgi:predicted metal-binding membrane protein